MDVVLVTWDVADHGELAGFERVRVLHDLPVLLCPGNHDVVPVQREVLHHVGGRAGRPVTRRPGRGGTSGPLAWARRRGDQHWCRRSR